VSPTTSLRTRSTATDYSESDQAEGVVSANEDVLAPVEKIERPEKEKKRRWRLSSTPKFEPPDRKIRSPSKTDLNVGSNATAGTSISSVNSAGHGRKSLSIENQPYPSETSGSLPQPAESGNGAVEKEPERRGPIGWLRGKMQERRERDAERRAKSPPNTRNDPSATMQRLNPSNERLPVRGKSMDIPRESRAQSTSERMPSTAAPSGAQQPAQQPIQQSTQQPIQHP